MTDVRKAFGNDPILTGVTFRLQAREKVALVGRNGTGKTTLLKILTGAETPDTGAVTLARGAKMGYLKQEAAVGDERTVLQEAEGAVADQLALRARLDVLEAAMESDRATADDVEEYGLLHERFLEAQGYSAERDVRTVLRKMGFADEEFDKPTSALSGGEKTRLALARMLLEEPDLLILDEPTNHLDLQATEWLEGWIRAYHGAVLLVSHDRAFLDSTAERVLEMKGGTVKAYPGPFEKYVALRREEDARLAEVARRQDLEIAKMDEYVRRFMNSQRTAQARGRLKLMNRLIENRVEAPKMEAGMKGGFAEAKRSGDVVLACEKLTVGFRENGGEEVLINGLDWTVRNGERWGVVGENGAGKSTLARVFLGEREPLRGRAKVGSNVVVGYFTQDARDLDPESSPLDTLVWELDMKPGEARDLLGRFLLTGDDVFRPIKTLSGGEKNKLSLAKLTQLQPNLLVLDEPTNHLDMASREALGEVLKTFKGTLVLISHDRWLLNETTDNVLDLRRDGPVIYGGGFAEYRSRRSATVPASAPGRREPAPAVPAISPRELSKEIARTERLVAQIEEEIERTEASLKAIERQLAEPPPGEDLLALSLRHQTVQSELEGRISAWESTSVRLEELGAMQGR